jgi:SAM-dependent methyltransferase
VDERLLQAQVEAARAYDALFVPALTGEWASIVADAAGIGPGDRVLDVACGTGVLAREAVRRSTPGGHVTGVDPNPGMLAVARERAPDVVWQRGMAESLPCEDAAFDVVVSQFGLMFVRDRAAAIEEMLRVLRPGGVLAVAVWDVIDATPAYAAEADLFARLAGTAAADALRAPFVLGDAAALAGLFEAAGAMEVAVQTRRGTARFPSVRVLVEADLRGWLPVMGVTLDEAAIQRILAAADETLRPHLGADASFGTSAHLLRATRR